MLGISRTGPDQPGVCPHHPEEVKTTAWGCRVPGSSPDVMQNLLALVVVLLEPGPELGGGDHQQRVKGFAQRCLKQLNQYRINGRHCDQTAMEWQEVQLFMDPI